MCNTRLEARAQTMIGVFIENVSRLEQAPCNLKSPEVLSNEKLVVRNLANRWDRIAEKASACVIHSVTEFLFVIL